ncbi:hypothetical protein SAMN05444277_101944 [Parafilimonas terrae]|uniref:Uncharacterized protein n=1 Tax=Parafilimonas terrae TaxID=1465490 RepID=A0A1I5STU1_9BACT|nr:hypothetical protein SAMN05444277_101944 [Parafilimonas terrae]
MVKSAIYSLIDKKLIKGLARKGFTNFITTDELYKLREDLHNKA